jgi:hypothetical protein
MSAPASALQAHPQRNVKIVAAEGRHHFESAIQQRISERAYELFESNGHASGCDRANWLQAEAEILQRGEPVRESSGWLTASAELQNSDPGSIQVLVLEDRAIVAGATLGVESASGESFRALDNLYLLFHWSGAVDPATAAAYMKGSTLVLTAKHCMDNDAVAPRLSNTAAVLPGKAGAEEPNG